VAAPFHALRRQVKSSFRKPLIIMSPKSLLRHPLVKSNIEDFTNEGFKTIIGDATTDAKKVENIVITSGKFYYELLDKKPDNTAIIRIEQYYPFDSVLLKKELSKYSGVKSITWAQEEPKNMGAWTFIRDYLEQAFDGKVKCVARSASPSPATGYLKFHNKEQEKLIKQVFSA
jgi:2-oxoglutarate dehydrogenase E1 component